jgi:hypothetical protein
VSSLFLVGRHLLLLRLHLGTIMIETTLQLLQPITVSTMKLIPNLSTLLVRAIGSIEQKFSGKKDRVMCSKESVAHLVSFQS